MNSNENRDNPVSALKEVFADCFPIGAALSPPVLDSHDDLLPVHFNSLTCENHMKMRALQPAAGEFTFENADAVVEYARTHGMRVRGHTLLWHHETGAPGWVFNEPDGSRSAPEQVEDRLRTHIREVMNRYRGRVECWDVVNEAISDRDGADELLRDSPWRRALGDGYVERVFRMAHGADPHALLFYNEYGMTRPAKRERTLRLLRRLLEAGAPVHGAGIQGHFDLRVDVDEVRRAIEEFASLGLKVEITELDISLYNDNDESFTSPPPERLARQAGLYGKLFALFREYRQVITGITFWGVADDRTWLDNHPVRGRKNWPLLFDGDHRPKEALCSILDGAMDA